MGRLLLVDHCGSVAVCWPQWVGRYINRLFWFGGLSLVAVVCSLLFGRCGFAVVLFGRCGLIAIGRSPMSVSRY